MKNTFVDRLIVQLNSISRMSAYEKAKETQTMTNDLIDHLRYRFGRVDHIVQLSEELQAVDNLLELSKVRYGEGLQYSKSVDPDVLQCYIPHYTLLAFIEYILNDEVERLEETWRIQVEIKKQDGHVQISIHDNGHIMINSKKETSIEYSMEYDSITSVCNRLKTYYQTTDHTFVEVFNPLNKGTMIVLHIPTQEGST